MKAKIFVIGIVVVSLLFGGQKFERDACSAPYEIPCHACFVPGSRSCAMAAGSDNNPAPWPGANDDVVLCEIAQCIGGQCTATVIADHIRNIPENAWGILRVVPVTAPFQQSGFKIKPDTDPWLCKWRESCDGCKKNEGSGVWWCDKRTIPIVVLPQMEICLNAQNNLVTCVGDIENP